MHTFIRKHPWWLYCLWVLFPLRAIGAPLEYNIKNFTPRNYQAGLQNWGATIGQDGKLYVANSEGLLVYNGNNWNCYPIASGKAIRAVQFINDTLYTAGDAHIEYWTKSSTGELNYTSLFHKDTDSAIATDTYWSIAHQGNDLYFHSFSRVLRYQEGQFEEVTNQCCMPLFQQDNHVYVHQLHETLYRLKKTTFIPLIKANDLGKGEVKFVLQGKNRNTPTHIGMDNGRILQLTVQGDYRLLPRTSQTLKNHFVDCGILLNDSVLAVGTLDSGIYFFDIFHDKYLQKIDNRYKLCGNTVHKMVLYHNTLYAMLDNGIAEIKLNPALRLWKSNREMGTLHGAVRFNDKLWLSTNLGLMQTSSQLDNIQAIQEVAEVPGETFRLRQIKGEVLCGSSLGLYKYRPQSGWACLSKDVKGITDYAYVAHPDEEYLICPSYVYITFLKYQKKGWQLHSQVTDLPNTFDKVFAQDLYTLWAFHKYKGLYLIKLNAALNDMQSVIRFNEKFPFKYVNMFRIDGQTIFFTDKGAFLYSFQHKSFTPYQKLNEDLGKYAAVEWIAKAKKETYWLLKENELSLYRINSEGATPLASISLINFNTLSLKSTTEIAPIGQGKYLMGTVDGTYVLDEQALLSYEKHSQIAVEGISYYTDNHRQHLALNSDVYRIPSDAHTYTFDICTSINSYSSLLSYQLDHDSKVWSPWSSNGKITLQKLSIGNHQLTVRTLDQKTKTIEFEVYAPFYKTTLAFFFYLLLVLLGIALWIRRRIQKKNKLLIQEHERALEQQEKQIISLQNDQLKLKLNTQKEELNNKLRNVSQKKEILLAVEQELAKQKEELGNRYPQKMYHKVLSIIRKGIDEEKDFLVLQNYYQDVNKSFYLWLKEQYPELTSQELKFCCMIRSNLSTKEIATVLNISPRSVEVKRYRLKKKLQLQDNINDWILELKPE
jgi:hypothetical protein